MRGLDGTQKALQSPLPFCGPFLALSHEEVVMQGIVFFMEQRSLQTTLLVCGKTLWLLISEY